MSPLKKFIILLSLNSIGCSILIGSIKPVDEMSNLYDKERLTNSLPSEWKNINDSEVDKAYSDHSDFAFQHTKTSAILSLSTSCRPSYSQRPPSFKVITKELLFGFTNGQTILNPEINKRSSEEIKIKLSTQNKKNELIEVDALLTTALNGTFENTPHIKNESGIFSTISIRILVFYYKSCIFDLMLVSRPEHFSSHLNDFTSFTQAIHLVQ